MRQVSGRSPTISQGAESRGRRMKRGGWILVVCVAAFLAFQNCSKPLEGEAPPQKAKLSSTTTLTLSMGTGTVPVSQSIIVYAAGGKAPFKYSLLSGGGSVTATDSQGTSATFFAPAVVGSSVIGVTDASGSSATGVIAIVANVPTPTPSPSASPSPGQQAIVYRHFNNLAWDHVFSLQNSVSGYTLEGPAFKVWTSAAAGMVGLYSCIEGTRHSVSTDSACEGARVDGLLGYIYTGPSSADGGANVPTGTKALYRMRYVDAIATFDSSEGAIIGYRLEKTLGYTLAP